MSSNKSNDSTHKLSKRPSQHLRLGSRSPSSIPSSPTSIHSSSSAIFERDIEPISSPSPPNSAHPPNPHRIPRSKATEQLDQSVPSVLDSAAEILTAQPSDDADISVLAPATDAGYRSGVASPIDSIRSRSPSPPASRPQPSQRSTLLLSIPSPTQHQLQHPVANLPHIGTPAPYVGPVVPPTATFPATAVSATFPPNALTPPSQGPSPVSSHRPVIHTTTVDQEVPETPPSIVTPTSAYFSTASSVDDSPTTTTRENPPHALPAAPPTAPSIAFTSPATPPPGTSTSHPPSPTHAATKRLSFMSYSDLLASTPTSTLPLSSLTTAASSSEPPPHIPSVSGATQAQAQAQSAAASVHGMVIGWDRDSVAMDDVGGEWEREGLGRGLEEQLEALMTGGRRD